MFKARTTKPEAGNKYYNTPSSGGYAVGAIKGNPLQAGTDILANCVGYAAGRFNEIIGRECWVYFQCPSNAENFMDMAAVEGLRTGSVPELGAIIVWAKGKTWNASDGAGHVAIVEKINEDGSIITSESGYGCKNPFWTTHREKGGGNWGAGSDYKFLGFIYQPTPQRNVLKKFDNGADVIDMQNRLYKYGYLRKSEIDGIFGTITLGALLAFQFEHNLTVDGICGPETKKKMM